MSVQEALSFDTVAIQTYYREVLYLFPIHSQKRHSPKAARRILHSTG
jgi:hypothetical protein